MSDTEQSSTQIILGYEDEPAVAFDVTESMIVEMIEASDMDHGFGEKHIWLRENVALLRDHGGEIIFDKAKRQRMAQDAVAVLCVMMFSKQKKLSDFPAASLTYYAAQSAADARYPKFSAAILARRLSAEEIRASSSAKYLLTQDDPDDLTKINNITPVVDAKLDGQGEGRVCIAIHAYWKNDGNNGIAAQVQESPDYPGEIQLILETVEEEVTKFAAMKVHSRENCEALLREYVSNKQQPSLLPLVIISYMEEMKLLTSDEFNGMMYIYRVGNAIEMERGDKPTERRAIRSL